MKRNRIPPPPKTSDYEGEPIDLFLQAIERWLEEVRMRMEMIADGRRDQSGKN